MHLYDWSGVHFYDRSGTRELSRNTCGKDFVFLVRFDLNSLKSPMFQLSSADFGQAAVGETSELRISRTRAALFYETKRSVQCMWRRYICSVEVKHTSDCTEISDIHGRIM